MRKSLLLTLSFLMVFAALPALAGWDEGVAAFKAKDFQGAAAEFQELVKQSPDAHSIHYMLGLSLQQLNRKEEALHHLRKAYDLKPSDLATQLALGRAYSNLKRYSEVNSLLGKVDASSLPGAQKAAFYQMRGQARFKANDLDNAVKDFAQLAKLKSSDAATQYLYGTTAFKVGQIDTAISALGKAVQLDSKDNDKKRSYAQVLITKGRQSRDKTAKKSSYLQASKVAKQMVASQPSYDNYMLLVSAELGAGLYEDAIGSGQAALSKKSDDWLAHYYLGQAMSSAKQYVEAEAPLKKAETLAGQADKKLVWTQLGYVYEKQKKYSQAIEAYQFAGNNAAIQRVKDNEETARFNEQVEEENARIKAMEEEARKLEEELKALEEGGGGR